MIRKIFAMVIAAALVAPSFAQGLQRGNALQRLRSQRQQNGAANPLARQVPNAARPGPAAPADPGEVTMSGETSVMNMDGAALELVLKIYGELVKKTIIVDPAVQGTLNNTIKFKSAPGQTLTDDERIFAYETILEMNQIHLEPYGESFIRALPRKDVRKEGIPLIELFGLDRMDASQNYYYADGVFDWFDSAAFKGGIIQSTTGRIFFPYVEPFGRDLRELLGDDDFAKEYCFDSLYTMTRTLAQQYADKNKFYLEGYYSSTVSGEISLGYSISQGSVSVTAGGVPLIENVDYIVDYTMGTVRIINESILSSGTPISVSSENNSFSMMSKTLLGTHINYELQPDFNIGGTFMNLSEKPLTQKNNFGDEPTSNSIWGLDLNYRHDAPFITRLATLATHPFCRVCPILAWAVAH